MKEVNSVCQFIHLVSSLNFSDTRKLCVNRCKQTENRSHLVIYAMEKITNKVKLLSWTSSTAKVNLYSIANDEVKRGGNTKSILL